MCYCPFVNPVGFFSLVWQVAGKPTYSHLTVRLIPKPEHATHTEENQLGEYQRQVDEQPLTDPTQHQPNTSGHKDAAGQILSYFSIKGVRHDCGVASGSRLHSRKLNNAINNSSMTENCGKSSAVSIHYGTGVKCCGFGCFW